MTYSYDPNGRKVGALYLAGERATFAYDPTGSRTTMVDWTGATTYAYDPLKRLISRSDPGALLLSLSRDAAGQLTNLTSPSGATSTYQFDLGGRITTVQDVDQQILKVYDAAGRLTSLAVQESVPGGWQDVSQTLYGLDQLSQVTTIVHTDGTNPVQTIISTYDPVGELTQQVVDGLASTFAYNAVGRVSCEQHGTSQPTTYTYDASRNRTVKNAGGSVTTSAYDAAQHLVTSILGSAPSTYTHDLDGNITVENLAGAVTTFVWGDDETMRNVIYSTGAISTYTYDGDGRRRSYIEPGGTLTTIVYLGRDILEERS
jgi:YD repeat-containing protein